MKPTDSDRSQPAQGEHSLAWAALVLLVGLAATALVSHWLWVDALHNDALRFASLARGVWETVETRVEKYEQGLKELAEWFGIVETPSLAEWANRMERFDLPVNYSGMIEVGYAPHLSGNLQGRWTNRVPEHWRREWFVPSAAPANLVLYVETPQAGMELVNSRRTLPAEDTAAASEAYRSASPRTTRAIPLATNASGVEYGFRMYVTAYNRDLENDPRLVLRSGPLREDSRVVRRGNALLGYVFGALSVDPFLKSVLGEQPLEVQIEWFAGTATATNRLNHAGTPVFALTPAYSAGLHTNLVVPWYGQKWTVACYPTARFYDHSERGRAWMAAGAGGALSVAFALLVLVQGRGRARAEALAVELAESRELLKAASDERARLSRELHDGTIQSLYAIGLTLGRTRKDGANREVVEGRLSEVCQQLDQVITELRQYLLTHAQTEPLEKPKSLTQALEALVERWRATQPAQFRLQADPAAGAELAPAVVVEILRITQEAVSNSFRHGQARNVSLWLRALEGGLRLEIADDGGGFDPKSNDRPGHGLANMRERAAKLGARLHIESQPGGPSTVVVEVDSPGKQ